MDEPTPIRGISYDPGRRRLIVRFVDGEEVAFVGVPDEVHRSFADSPSKGRFYADEIEGRYPYNKLK
jgi:lysyl-tRNA synthetase class 2